MTPTDPLPETRVPSAVTHSCPGGCGTELPNHLFACKKCFRQLPHDLRQGIVRTKRLRYLDAERLLAIHEAEDYLEGLAAGEAPPAPKPPQADENPVAKATNAALEKAQRNDALGQACAVDFAKRKGQLTNLPRPAAQRMGKGKR